MLPTKNRFILDTSAYGLLCEQDDISPVLYEINQRRFIIAGSRLIRKELRDIPKKIKLKGNKLRLRALQIYDTLVLGKRDYSATTIIDSLAKEYYLDYRGKRNWGELETDLRIVATAAIHQVPTIVTNDFSTMASEEAISAYKQANEKYELPMPRLISTEEFLALLR